MIRFETTPAYERQTRVITQWIAELRQVPCGDVDGQNRLLRRIWALIRMRNAQWEAEQDFTRPNRARRQCRVNKPTR